MSLHHIIITLLLRGGLYRLLSRCCFALGFLQAHLTQGQMMWGKRIIKNTKSMAVFSQQETLLSPHTAFTATLGVKGACPRQTIDSLLKKKTSQLPLKFVRLCVYLRLPWYHQQKADSLTAAGYPGKHTPLSSFLSFLAIEYNTWHTWQFLFAIPFGQQRVPSD